MRFFEKIRTYGVGGFTADFFVSLSIVGVGWFLIGYYTDFDYLKTGYQDWIYHAFRVKALEAYGVASWDHIWSNGINHWRAYQYIPHYAILWTTELASLSITQAMLYWSVGIFIAIRLSLYAALRVLGIPPLFAGVAVLLSYAFTQQWIAIKDFSIYIGMILLVPYLFLWIKTLENEKYLYILTALTGILWSVHPVLGYSATGLLFFLLLANGKFKDFKSLLLVGVLFLISSAPFSIPYLLSGYSVINPVYVSPQFLKETVAGDYMGLSFIYFIILAFCWIILLFRAQTSPRWAKFLLVYSSLYLVLIYFGQKGYLPDFINKFQFSRAIPLIAIMLSLSFGAFLEAGFGKIRSILVATVLLLVLAFNLVQSADTASIYSGQPVRNIENPVALYFAEREVPRGSVYFDDVSEASYFAKPGVRFVTSYNEHLQPHPYSMRFRALMKTDISYTGITARQIDLIEDYSTVLGVEYLFVPKLSPLVAGLSGAQKAEERLFEVVDEVEVNANTYSVLRSRKPIANAYALEAKNKDMLLQFKDLPKPTLKATSYKEWDDEVSRVARLIRDEGGHLRPLPIEFVDSNILRVDTGSIRDMEAPALLVTQSYDRNWRLTDHEGSTLQATNLRFMYFEVPKESIGAKVELRNTWPKWHWPVQFAGVAVLTLMIVVLVVKTLYRRFFTEEHANQ